MPRRSSIALALALLGCRCQVPGLVTCVADADCGPGGVCAEGACRGARCTSGAECPSGRCESGRCVIGIADGGAGDGGCALRERCAGVCCAADKLCVQASCAPPPTCVDTNGCPPIATCEVTTGTCRDWATTPGYDATCSFKPAPAPLAPRVAWAWTSASTTFQPASSNVMMTPAVADLDQDGTPEVVFTTFTGQEYWQNGVLRAAIGSTGVERWQATNPGRPVLPTGSVAVGNLDADPRLEIVAILTNGGLAAFRHNGSLFWESHDATGNFVAVPAGSGWGGPALADLDRDGKPEVVFGFTVLDATGKIVRTGPTTVATNCCGATPAGPLSLLADANGDGTLDLLSGARAVRFAGADLWTAPSAEGFPAVADFDRDGIPEVVVVNDGQVRVLSAATGQTVAGPLLLPASAGKSSGRGGPPAIADVDGDGAPEFVVAGASAVSAFKVDLAGRAIRAAWSAPTQDATSSATGCTAFDFDGNGASEVVYNDECFFRVYDGKTGAEIHRLSNSTCTAYEFPVVADATGDGRADVVLVSNDICQGLTACAALPGFSGVTRGVRVLTDSGAGWSPTRQIFNQHTYHGTNVCDGKDDTCPAAENQHGRIPSREAKGWLDSRLNGYRQNVPTRGARAAPDLTPEELLLDTANCPGPPRASVRVINRGAVGAISGIPVTFYTGRPFAGGVALATVRTRTFLSPSQSELLTADLLRAPIGQRFTLYVVVDDDGTGTIAAKGVINECFEANNLALLPDVLCPASR